MRIRIWIAWLAGCFLCSCQSQDNLARSGQALRLVPMASTWKYSDDGSDQGTAWRNPGFDDAAWASGAAELGYGDDDDEATVVSFGPDPDDKHITTYFRRTFEVENPAGMPGVMLSLLRDDGAVVYLNGSEVLRSDMPSGSITSGTQALSSEKNEKKLDQVSIDPDLLQDGSNLLAVEVHQVSSSSEDLSFDLELHEMSPTGAATVEIEVDDGTSYHVHPPGQDFSVTLTPQLRSGTVSGAIRATWVDFRGEALGAPVVLPLAGPTTLTAPGAGEIGYYGLRLESDYFDVGFNPDSGERTELGFAILPEIPVDDRGLDPASRLGMVQIDYRDPYMVPGYIKTRTTVHGWDAGSGQLDADSWRQQIADRRSYGHLEIPLSADDEWRSDDDAPIPQAELDTLEDKMRQYFEADTRVIYWEMGIEERDDAPHYWPNLAEKIRVVREAADETNPAVQLAYQVVNQDYDKMEAFFAAKAQHGHFYYDILSLHPYPWTDFKSPEEWMPAYLATTRDLMIQHGVDMPIWITEMGAPHQGTLVGFFGYTSHGGEVRGTSRRYGAVYLVRTIVMALSLGVERVLWYNYIDRGDDIHYPEDHFGTRDHWDHVKPAYPAFVTLVRLLKDKTPLGSRDLPGDVHLHEFQGVDRDVIVAWAYPRGERDVLLADLRAGLTPAHVVEITDTVGGPLSLSGDTVRISRDPVFIVIDPDAVTDQIPPAPPMNLTAT